MIDMLAALRETSRTFYLPVIRLPAGLQEAVAAGYLSMRSLDEIEDHPGISNTEKAALLSGLSLALQGQTSLDDFERGPIDRLLAPYGRTLAPVSMQLADWARLAPAPVAPRIWEASAAMADRMAHWATTGWRIDSLQDLDRYTFSVAGAVGILLCDLLAYFDGAQVDRSKAVLFGRGLQLVNILRNRADDLARGVDFLPPGFTVEKIGAYARECLVRAEFLRPVDPVAGLPGDVPDSSEAGSGYPGRDGPRGAEVESGSCPGPGGGDRRSQLNHSFICRRWLCALP